MLNPVGQRSQNQSLHLGYRFFLRRPVSHGSRQGWNLSDPPPVVFLFDFDLHDANVVATAGASKWVLGCTGVPTCKKIFSLKKSLA